MPSVDIKKDLYEDIVEFCKLNGIEDTNNFINQTLNSGFDMKKYGDSFAMFFGKKEDDIVHLKPKDVQEEVKAEVPTQKEEVEIKPEPKKRGRKKKDDPVVETIVEAEDSIEVQPSYVIKQTVVEKPKEKIQVRLKRPDDNYGVYDEF